jgi:AraC-like DNA-binding protein
MEILASLATHTFRKDVSVPIAKDLRYIEEHIEENPTITELADLSNVSEVYFRKQFKASLGMTPVEYRNSLRLDRARSYLEYGDISVQEISDMLGYATVSHFIKVFREKYGISPLQYRKQSRKE